MVPLGRVGCKVLMVPLAMKALPVNQAKTAIQGVMALSASMAPRVLMGSRAQ